MLIRKEHKPALLNARLKKNQKHQAYQCCAKTVRPRMSHSSLRNSNNPSRTQRATHRQNDADSCPLPQGSESGPAGLHSKCSSAAARKDRLSRRTASHPRRHRGLHPMSTPGRPSRTVLVTQRMRARHPSQACRAPRGGSHRRRSR